MANVADIVAAAEHGAALVYHDILAVEGDVRTWSAAHPEVAPLVADGEKYASTLLQSAGFPVDQINSSGRLMATAVMSALKAMAAADATVPSKPASAPAASVPPAP